MSKPSLNAGTQPAPKTADSKSADKPIKKPAAKAKSAYPTVRVGDTVLWYFAGDVRNEPLAAIVTLIRGQGNLCLAVFSQNGLEMHDGVKHRDDPTMNENHRIRRGCWGTRD